MLKKILVFLIKLILVLAIGVLAGTFLYTLSKRYLVFSASNVMAIWMISFIFALITRSSYGSKLFLFDLILGSFLVSFYPFSQGFFIILLILLAEKLFKIL